MPDFIFLSLCFFAVTFCFWLMVNCGGCSHRYVLVDPMRCAVCGMTAQEMWELGIKPQNAVIVREKMGTLKPWHGLCQFTESKIIQRTIKNQNRCLLIQRVMLTAPPEIKERYEFVQILRYGRLYRPNADGWWSPMLPRIN